MNFSCCEIFSQGDISFVDKSNKWKVEWQIFGIPFPEIRTYFFNGDSMFIDNHYYQQMVYTQEGSNEIKKSFFYFRQEGSKVFKSMNGKAYLLYDFDLQVDGRLYPFGVINNYHQKITQTSDFALNNGVKVKKLEVICNNPDSENQTPSIWLNGIGDLTHPFTPEPQCSLFDPQEFETLMCFASKGHVLFNNENFPDCTLKGHIRHLKFTDEINKWKIIYYNQASYVEKMYFLKKNEAPSDDFTFYYFDIEDPQNVIHTGITVKQEEHKVILNNNETLVDFSLTKNDKLYNAGYYQTVFREDTIELLDKSQTLGIVAYCGDLEDSIPNSERLWIEGIGNIRHTFDVNKYCNNDASGEDERFSSFYRGNQLIYTTDFTQKLVKPFNFVDDENLWIYKSGAGDSIVSYRKKFFINDSLRNNGKVYYALKISYEESGDNFDNTEGFYREEKGKVFKFNGEKEELFLDFNLKVGDIFESEIEGSPLKYKVTSVSNIIYPYHDANFVTTKKMVLKCMDNELIPPFEWRQGIGSFIDNKPCESSTGMLSCFFKNSSRIFPYPNQPSVPNCWSLAVSNSEIQDFRISPNPASDILSIHSEHSLLNILIFDINGSLIRASRSIDKIDVTDLGRGFYILKVDFKNGQSTHKKWMKI